MGWVLLNQKYNLPIIIATPGLFYIAAKCSQLKKLICSAIIALKMPGKIIDGFHMHFYY